MELGTLRPCGTTQAYGLERFPALDAVGESVRNLGHKASLILGVSEGPRGGPGRVQPEKRLTPRLTPSARVA